MYASSLMLQLIGCKLIEYIQNTNQLLVCFQFNASFSFNGLVIARNVKVNRVKLFFLIQYDYKIRTVFVWDDLLYMRQFFRRIFGELFSTSCFRRVLLDSYLLFQGAFGYQVLYIYFFKKPFTWG